MYDELVKELRDSAEWADRLALLMGRAEGDAHAPVMRKAADAIEELSRAADAIPHVCECCIGCEVESGDCGNAFVLSPKRAKEYLSKPHWISVTERLPDCEWGAEVGNIEWISCGMVFAGCFGRGGKYRDAYFRTWTDGTEGIDAKDADYWRPILIPQPPKEK